MEDRYFEISKLCGDVHLMFNVHQVCFVMIESLSHTTDDLIFKWNFTNPLYVSPEIQLPQVLTIV